MRRFWFFLRCLNHWDRAGHWPVKPAVYDDFFVCQRCQRGTPQRLQLVGLAPSI